MTIEPKLMSAEDVAEYQRDSDIDREFAPQDIKELLAHIAAQERRIADLELRLQIATETNAADRKRIADLETGLFEASAYARDPVAFAERFAAIIAGKS